MNLKRAALFICLSTLFLGVFGCGDGRPERVPVSGQVLIDGKPLSVGYIRFVPSGSRPSTGKIQPDGRFTLGCYALDDGVVQGTHTIEVNGQEAIGDTKIKWHAPKKYASGSTAGLSREITGPESSLTIDLTWDGQTGPFVEVVE
jgi:hypothetical protein